jgi:hypothetical protein
MLPARARAPSKAPSLAAAGEIPGVYVDTSNVNHGFLRARNGTFTTFGVPGAGTGSGQGTLPSSINQEGAIIGNYIDERCESRLPARQAWRHNYVGRSGRGHSQRSGYHTYQQQRGQRSHRLVR